MTYNTSQIKKAQRQRRTVKAVAVLCTLLFIAGLSLAFLYFFQKPVVTISPEKSFAVGESVSLYDLVLSVEKGELISENAVLDSQKPGTKKVVFLIRDRLGHEKEESLVIEFYDNVPPTITAPEKVSTIQGTEIDLMEGVSAADENGVPCTVALSGEYDFNKAGEYELTLSASDSAGNLTETTLKLIVEATPFDENGYLVDGTYTTSKGFPMTVVNGTVYIDGYLIANKSYPLPKTYTASWMTPETQSAYQKMQKAAAAEGLTISVRSAYRSWYDQDYIFRGYVRNDGLEKAETYSARPGHSEHQTGLGIDFLTSSTSVAQRPEVKKVLDWMSQNAQKFGFILRYPEGKTDETGYIYEPWHFRYVGTELAEKLYNNGDWITMEDYFGIDSAYKYEFK